MASLHKIIALTMLFSFCFAQNIFAFTLQDYESEDITKLQQIFDTLSVDDSTKDYLLGNIYFLEKDFTKAEQEYRKAIQKMQVYAPLYYKLAESLRMQGVKLDEAEELAIIALHAAKEKDFLTYLDSLANIRTYQVPKVLNNHSAIANIDTNKPKNIL